MNPSARESNVLHQPRGEVIPAAAVPILPRGSRIPSPQTVALSHSLNLMAEAAQCNAARVAEQAVSTGKLGPVKPSTNDRRPDRIDIAYPLAAYALIFVGCY